MNKAVCVFCSSSDNAPAGYFEVADKLGRELSERGWSLVYGGGSVGLMGALARSVHRHGGRVVGVIPERLNRKEIAYADADQLLVTADMRDRKTIMEMRAEAFVALPGGFGTLEEILEIITLKQLKFHHKPVVLINAGGFFTPLVKLFESLYANKLANPRYRGLYVVVEGTEEALSYIESYEPR